MPGRSLKKPLPVVIACRLIVPSACRKCVFCSYTEALNSICKIQPWKTEVNVQIIAFPVHIT